MMKALTCAEVEEYLDLLAAGECAADTRLAVENHLEQCPACAASYADSRRLMGLLTLQLDTAGQRRLRERIEHDQRRNRQWQVVLPLVRRALAVAALLLASAGLILLFHKPATDAT